MGVPRAHSTKGQKGRRRSHLALKAGVFSICSHCKKPILPHMVCKSCGYYKDKEIIGILAKELKKKEKEKKKNS